MIWKIVTRMMCRDHRYHQLTSGWFLAGELTLTLATILANVELAKAQATKGVSINQSTADGRTGSAYFAEADKKDTPVVILIH